MATTYERPADRNEFEIAILCALRTESDAVQAILDEDWEDDALPYGKADRDPNYYTTGRIGNHNVVLAHMPGMGKSNTARVASAFLSSFPKIRLGLVVGVCGGVPHPPALEEKEIVLGDVIISTGVVQFDYGRQLLNRVIIRDTLEGNLGPPNPEIRSFLSKLQGYKGRSKLQKRAYSYIADVYQNEDFDDWHHPGISTDKAFHSEYHHVHRGDHNCICDPGTATEPAICDAAAKTSCAALKCDEANLLHREHKKSIMVKSNSAEGKEESIIPPELHFGLIGSGDVVMKSSVERDRLAKEENVIAFEMEGPGAWETFPTIVIKGVCDYADSHKNKKWQKYAAITAAACAKSLLKEWQGIDKVLKTTPAQDSNPAPKDPKPEDDAGNGPPPGKQPPRSDGGANFYNYGKVGNQATNQTINGNMTFS